MSGVYASLDLGGTNLKCAFAGVDGKILQSKSIPTESYRGPEYVLDQMAHIVLEIQADLGCRAEGLGIGIPGLVDRENGIIKFLPNFPTKWKEVKIAEPLSEMIDCPVYLLNDVRTATLGEMTFGHGENVSNMIFFALGTGIGGGVVVNGKLRLGPLGAAGEIGHQIILPDGPICGCGNRGCLETLASGPAFSAIGVRLLRSGLAPVLHRLTNGNADLVNPEIMGQAALQGDYNTRQEIIKAAEYLGIGVVNLVVALHPELIVLGGGVSKIGEILFETVRKTLQQRIGMFPVDGVEIKSSKLGDLAGTLGGIALAMNKGLLGDQDQ